MSIFKFVDTHCNLPNILRNLKLVRGFEKEHNVTEAWETFRKEKLVPVGFEKAISVASDTESRAPTLQLISSSESVYGVFGIHPLYAKLYTEECEQGLLNVAQNPKAVAWGEIGLDYHAFEGYDYAKPDLQKQIFESQMKHAVDLKKPVVIHTREAEEDTFQMMSKFLPRDWRIHVHCFTDSSQFAKRLLEHFPNLYIGFTGVITFKNATALRQAVDAVPLTRLLLETDGPFMAPVPHRGQVCHPGHIPLIAEQIATIKGLPPATIYELARENTKKMYGI